MANQTSILRCFFDVDMRNGHDGLTKLAKREGIKTGTVEPGQFVVFVNSAKTKVKIYASGEVIAYMKARGRIDLNVIREIPRAFNGGRVNYDDALKKILLEKLSRKRRLPAPKEKV